MRDKWTIGDQFAQQFGNPKGLRITDEEIEQSLAVRRDPAKRLAMAQGASMRHRTDKPTLPPAPWEKKK